MQERTRKRLLLVLGLLLGLLLAAWWYSGFSLDFMRFFAAEPGEQGAPRPGPTDPPPAGCYYQDVQCIQAPCPPILTCPPSARMVQCTPATQTVKVGASAAVTASGGDGNYNWFSPEGNPSGSAAQDSIGASYQVSYGVAGTKKVTVTAGRTGEPQTQDSVACTVIVTP